MTVELITFEDDMMKDEFLNQFEDDASNTNDVLTSISKAGNAESIQSAVDRIEIKRKKNGLPRGIKKNKDGTEIRRLTTKQTLFANYVLGGDKPKDAYRKAYDCAGSADATVYARANELMKDRRIALILEPLITAKREIALENERRTRQHIMEELFKHSDDENVNIGARLRALELMGKAVGMFVDKVETKIEEINAEQLKEELASHLKLLDNMTQRKRA